MIMMRILKKKDLGIPFIIKKILLLLFFLKILSKLIGGVGSFIKNNKLLSSNEINRIISDSLYYKGLIDYDLYVKCGKKEHISSLPYDLRSNDKEKLDERRKEIEKRISIEESNINEWRNEINDLKERKDAYTKIVDELDDASSFVEVLNRRYTKQYRSKFDKSFSTFLTNGNIHRTLYDYDGITINSNDGLSWVELHARIMSGFTILDNTAFKNGLLLTEGQMSILNDLYHDISEYSNISYSGNLGEYSEGLINNRINNIKESANQLKEIMDLPKDFLDAEEKVNHLSQVVAGNSEDLMDTINEISRIGRNIGDAKDRIKDYNNELRRLKNKNS